ncbi:hypothetical protein A3A38_01970 [Candidatus Kaiserbacteria bacterium RIFCSPLOWO2_01_FULL_53_17]|uniref:Uncharacterized protein n=1 Tax=Candidatus Kaiserbacteria bacterium RIFCSPLOWO2_01_FULL_53_17 TaxID=1798511 RepID=A0A1F6EFV6_9BACT|nr:MAG: hypothetical protein A3A38_01970 [Candidatus Kaiserbacteria bacterium RIFCSPLOWO2_01_FULL_53_17]
MYEYNDGLRPAGRNPRLYLAKGSEVRKFTGENIPGFSAVASSRYEKRGKWSNTTFQLDLAPGVRPLHFLSPMHGTWGDNLGSWGEVAEQLGLPVDVAQAIVRREYPSTGERLDKLEQFALATETEGAATEVVVISFGSPTNRAIREGYWKKSKSSQSSDGRRVTVEPGMGEYGAEWGKPVVVEPERAKVLSSRHTPGMHNGYWTIEVAVPIAQKESK